MQKLSYRAAGCALATLIVVQVGCAQSRTYEIYYAHQLTNTSSTPAEDVRIFVPVPAEDDFQTVRDFQIELWDQAATISARRDPYGQSIMQLTIPRIDPNETIEVGFSCDVTLKSVRPVRLNDRQVGTLDDIPEEIRGKFTTDVPGMYDLGDETVRARARALAEAHPNLLARVRAIYDLVASELSYERSGGWDSAAKVLQRGNGSCSEFSFAFSALCRASGIPTRLVGGSSVRHDPPYKDTVWHRWIEVYLPPWGWVPMDPTRDRKHRPDYRYFGSRSDNLFVLTKVGGGAVLGKQCLAANTHTRQLRRARSFVWTQGAGKAYAAVWRDLARGNIDRANAQLGEIVLQHPGSKYARLAADMLAELGLPVPTPTETAKER